MIGIYFLKQNDEIVYIGQSVEIESRVEKHKRSDKEFNTYSVEECDKSELRELEKKYVLKFKPKYNQVHNPDVTIERFHCSTVEKRNKLVGFQARESEEKRIIETVSKSGKTKSQFLRDTVMKEVEKQEKKK